MPQSLYGREPAELILPDFRTFSLPPASLRTEGLPAIDRVANDQGKSWKDDVVRQVAPRIARSKRCHAHVPVRSASVRKHGAKGQVKGR